MSPEVTDTWFSSKPVDGAQPKAACITVITGSRKQTLQLGQMTMERTKLALIRRYNKKVRKMIIRVCLICAFASLHPMLWNAEAKYIRKSIPVGGRRARRAATIYMYLMYTATVQSIISAEVRIRMSCPSALQCGLT